MVLKEKLIIIADTPQHNGIAKHTNRTLVGGILTMLQQSKFIKGFWGEAILIANYLQNCSPTKFTKNDQTFYELYMGYKLDLSYFKIFGCIAYALIQIDHRKKFDSRSIECIFLGYNDESTWLIG